ncbi:MAG: sulfite exporter TauE/SafE family protein [Clostridia bacterium]|nr:sulfite exporter TauE/SafE family protein [Clostridia bacterium]
MQVVWLIIAGFCGGIIAGMGMGGGTLLIPVLTLFFGFSQKLSQAINLIVFLPVSIVSIFIYAKKRLIDFTVWWKVTLPASLVAVVLSFFAAQVSSSFLRVAFAVFLILIAVVQIVIFCYKKLKNGNSGRNNSK